MKKIVIIGGGGFGREVDMLIDQINKADKGWTCDGYYDDGISKGKVIGGKPVLGNVEDLLLIKEEVYVVIAVGDPVVKRKIYERVKQNTSIKYPVLIHPNVEVGRNVSIGEGSILCAGNILTVDIQLGIHTILNLSCTIGHDTRIGDFCSIMPGVNISGEVIMKDCVYVGTGAKIINQVTINENVTVGSGAVVTKNLEANCTAVGVPAKALNR
jgi:sugar O-acyltransferase (sialic acid O-acetyltransferase NeuD family)